MKKIIAFLITVSILLLSACQVVDADACKHRDGDGNGVCDRCDGSVVEVIDFYAVNDLHGKLADGDGHPGVDELTTYLKSARQTDEHTVFLSSGDMWQGSSESNMTGGMIITDWMNSLDFASMTVGNHEFDWGEEYIESNSAAAEFPILAINIYDRDTNERVEYCESSVMIERGNVKIGIIGAIGDCYSSISPDKTGGVYFKVGSELTELVKEEAIGLRALGADIIVYSLHDGHERSKNSGVITESMLSQYYDLSLSDGYVDLVFEGHTHQSYSLVDAHGVYHLQGGGDNDGITHAELAVNYVTSEVVSVNSAEVVPTYKYEPLKDDTIVAELLEKYADEIAEANRVLGYNNIYRSSDYLRGLVAKLYLEYGEERWGEKYDIFLGGGFISVRSPYDIAAGEVTYAQVQSIFPFDNELVLCSISGRNLKSRFLETTNSSYFIHCSAYGNENIEAIDDNATYYVIVDSYTSTYAPNRLTEIERYGSPLYARDMLAEYIENGGLV
ncbi:MAG: bifunctional metallophosphatase/5'-nucleotidase [Clostridia bacterium]|nr:bifunctional metallophosphatase/5'-nucleotidase [Clostridia bacterium]